MDESNNDLTVCLEERIELGEMVDQSNREINCLLCEERFNSIVRLDVHLTIRHHIHRQKLLAYLELHSNEKPEKKGKIDIA